MKVLGIAEQSAKVITSGVTSTTSVAKTLPGATITILNADGTNATIYSTSTGTPKSNSYQASLTDASYDFFILPGATFSVRVTGTSGGVTITPFTRSGYTAPGTAGIALAICGGTADTSLLAALSALGGTIQIPKGTTCASNTQTLSAALQVDSGGFLKPITGQIVTLTGPQIGGPWQRFTNATAGLGTIRFTGNVATPTFFSEWWGSGAAAFTAMTTAQATLGASSVIYDVSSGTFTNTQMNLLSTSNVGGLNFQTAFQHTQGNNYTTAALFAGIKVPNTSTVYQPEAVAGYIDCYSSLTHACVAGDFVATARANGTNIFGLNVVAQDDIGSGGINRILTGMELDIGPFQEPAAYLGTLGIGVVLGGNGTGAYDGGTVAANTYNTAAIDIGTSGLASSGGGNIFQRYWGIGIQINNDAINGLGMTIGRKASATTTADSAGIGFNSRLAGVTKQAIITGDSSGNLVFTPQMGQVVKSLSPISVYPIPGGNISANLTFQNADDGQLNLYHVGDIVAQINANTSASYLIGGGNFGVGTKSPAQGLTVIGTLGFGVDNVGHTTAGILADSSAAPTISSGFGTSPSIVANGAIAGTINVGTGGVATGGVLTMPAATTGWVCNISNRTALAANRADQRTTQTATTTTTVTIQNQTISTGAALAWTASDVLTYQCRAY